MKSKAKNLLVKLTSLVLAVFLVLPSQVWAADLLKKDSRKYTANSSIMGLATQTSPDDSKESLAEEADRQTLLKAKQATDQMDAYTIEKSATLSKTTKEIKYQYIIKSKAPSIESEKKENIYAIFALNNNTDLTDIKVDKVTTLDESGKEIKATYQASNPGIFANDTNISTLGIRSEKQANDLLYYLSAKVDDEAIAKIEKGDYSPIFALDMVLANNDKKAIYENRYALEVNKYTEEAKSDERLLEIKEEEKLEEVEESKSLIKGEYNPESNGLFDKNPATITWTDYILSTDDKEFAYDIDLDKAQETENSEISVEFYEAKENGFILNNSFSQKLPFANSIKLQIPKGQLARITLTTTINKEANAKEFTYNGKLLANPDHKVDASTEDSTTEEKANDDPDPLPEQKEESKEKSKDKEKAESDKTEITLEADPETNEVIVDPDLIKEEKADKNEEDQDYSAIDLNRDSVIRKFQEEENADPIMEIAINNIASLFNDYNKEAISYEDFLASLKEQSKDIDKEDFRAIATGLLAGINKDNYKVANIEIDTLLDDIYGKETITEIKEDEKAVEDSSIENNTDDDIPTQTIDQNLDLDSLDTENEADSLSPEEKDKQKALESFDKALDQVKEESKKPQDDDRTLFGNISEGVKGIFGKSNLQKADSELKAALEEGKSLEEIQALLLDLGEKYELNRKDEARLMADNEDAIKALIKRDADQNFRPNILMGDDISPLNDKKFTIRTRFDTSTATGPIEAGQYFNIHLDDKLTVKNPSSLKNITYKRRVIAEPIYDSEHNTIKYKIVNDINDDISIPVNVDVDYDTAKTPKDKSFTVINSISGLGVVDPKALAAEQIDKNGNPAGTILEEGRDDVVQIVGEDDRNYKMNMDIVGHPAVAGMDMTGINWTLRVDSTVDLKELGYKLNLTTVEGSGLGEIQDVKINGKSVDLTDQLDGKLGISDSKHHALNESAKTLVYTFNTPVTNKQASYMIDVSTILTAQNKVGALRHIINEGYPQDKIEENSPNRTSMNNRTTIKGEFKSEDKAEWTITDAVSTGDTNNGLPLETRTPQNQDFDSGNRAVYSINEGTGMMEVKNPESTISSLPAKETDPKGKQAVGNIAVYKFRTSLNTPDKPTDYSVGGVTISKYKDITVDQNWSLAEGYEKMPSQKLTVTDDNNRELGKIDPDLLEETGHQRTVTIPDVRFWQIANDGKASMIDHKVVQTLPTDIINVKGQDYKFKEIANYYDVNSKTHYITNALVEYNDQTPATFTVVKVDSKDPQKRLKGAKFYLLGAEIGITTNDKGEATFNNIKPGTYYLKETKAPTGYKLDQEEKIITISNKGEVSVSGKNAQFSSGSGKTDILEHSDYDKWKDFMNTQHYGKVDENGDLKFYVYLKPYDQRVGGRTDKDTTFNISIPGVDLKDSNIKVYDVNPNQRPDIFASMNNQNVDQKLSSLGQITLGAPNNNGAIEGQENVQNPLSGNTGYQISFPQGRFGDNWGFLVEVNANIEDKDSTVLSYDWLAKEGPANQSKIRANVNLSKNSDENGHPTITISNEEFAKSPIEVAKFADTSTDGNKDRLGGAEFVLKNENGLVLANKVTNKDGKVSFGEYPTGKYYLEEVKAPDGYEKSNVYFKVTVDEKGQVSYDARFKNSSGTPTAGVDYYIEREEGGQQTDKAVVTYVNQNMQINDDEGAGYFRGIWEAYRLESLKYHLDAKISNAAPGSRFEIQFDPNLDFTQYFKTFPNLYFKGKMIAEPYFDYKTNLLTYVFNKNSLSNGETTFSIDLKGIIPSKFYATHSGDWNFTNVVAPNQKTGTIIGNRVQNLTVPADYGAYDSHETKGKFPSQAYYFRDVYKADDGNWYVTAIGYYNPLGDYKTGNANKIWFNWKFAEEQGPKHEIWQGHYDPPYYLDDVKIYETTIPPLKRYDAHPDYNPPVNDYMPLSMGVRPEQNPDIYSLVYHADIDHTKAYNRSQGGFNLSYEPNKVTSTGPLYETQNPPLTISVPKINPTKDAYLIEQTFRIRDIDEFNTHWRAFYMANGDENGNRAKSLNSFFVTGPNKNYSKADQTGIELPSYAKEVVGIINKKYQPASFKITKLDDANHNKKLQGATFELIDSDGYKIYRRSNQNGEVEFKDLAPGKYTLKEYRAPEGYIKSTKEWKVTVYSDGNVKITSTSIIGGGEEYTGKDTINIPVTNKPAGQKFRVYKKDGDGRPLAGAKFKIYDPEDKDKDKNFPIYATSDQNGIVDFNGTPQENKDYVLEEVESPAGYKPLNKKWVIRIENGKTKIYTYSKSDGNQIKSILGEAGTHWVNVKERPTTGWSEYDNRRTGWAANSSEARYLGTRIVAINKDENYVIQRYVINPEARQIGKTTASIHRQSPYDPNMDWYDESNFDQHKDIKIFTLDKAVSGLISDIRLADYEIIDISSQVNKEKEVGKYNEPDRLKLSLPETDKPIVVDIKVKYKSDLGGVGTGMDWSDNNSIYWKADYYERVTDIVPADPTKREAGSIIGSYVAEGSLDVTNELKTYGFKIKKVKKVKEGDDNTVIPGAVFKLTGPDDSQDERYMTSGKDGMISFEDLKPGIYTLEETEPAPGYEKTDEKWTVTITEKGKAYIKSNSETSNKASLRKAKAYAANDGLEISDSLVDTDNSQGDERRTEKIDYEVSNLKDNDGFRNQIDVTSSVEYLGNDEFKVRYDMKNITGSTLSNKRFEVAFDNNSTFVGGSTHTWKWSKDGEGGDPNNPANISKWHSGYDPNTKKIGIKDNELTIPDGDTASITFRVQVRSNLGINDTVNLVRYIRYDGANITPYPQVKKVKLYGINYDAEGGTITTEPMDWATNGPLVEIKDVSPKAGYTKTAGPTVKNNTTGGNITVRNDNKFKMPDSDVTINATFEANTYKVNKGKIENGSISLPDSAKTDQVVNITDIRPNDGYKLGEITVTDSNGKSVEVTNNTFKMPAGEVTVNATFVKKDYEITKQKTVNGTFTVPETAEAGSTVTITLKPDKGYEKDTISYRVGDVPVQVDGNSFTMPASDVVVDVTFKPIPPKDFTITVDPATNGSVSADKQSAKENEEVTLTVKADEGYELDQLLVDGKPVEVTDGKYKLTMPNKAVTVSATFKKKPIIPPEGSKEIPEGGFATITNKQTGLDLKIIKRDNYDRRLEKAEFELEKYTDRNYTDKDTKFEKLYGVSDQNGYVTLKDKNGKPVSLPVGFYRLTETQSPSGYKKPQAPFDIEVYEDAGQLKAKYKGPEHTSYDYIQTDKSYDNTSVQTADNGIKYMSKLVSINTESKTYIQRIYIDTREYTGRSDKINIQISPKHKREETDRGPGNAPTIDVEGVKTAYRSTYKITGAPNDDNFADTVLNNYDLSRNDVTMLNTARWRPFDWGFDEDIMNLDKGGVYYIDVEGFYDDAILTGKDNHQDGKETITNPDDLQKLELNFDFYDGAREFQQAVGRDSQGNIKFEKVDKGSYQAGNLALGLTKFEKSPDGQLGKTGGQIDPPLNEDDRTRVSTSIDLQTLYSSKNYTEVPQEGMSVINEAERYNVTFSKHGRDNPKDKVDSEAVTTNRLEGAIFKLQKEIVNTYVDVPGSYVGSAFNGYFGFRNLEPGRYRLMEVKAPEGYKPITDPLLYFTIKTVKTNTGEVVDPESGDIVDIKTVNVRFESKGTTYNLSKLQMVDPKDTTNKLDINDVDSKDINIETSKIVNPDTGNEVLLKDMIVVGKEQFDKEGNSYYNEYPVKDIKIVPGSSGYISLEYNEANGVYQYLPEKSTSEKDGKLIDFVTSATAKNMGKIINEKPGQGEVKITKVAQVGNEIKADQLLPGAKFKLTRLTEKEGEEEKDLIKTGTVGEDGTLTFDELPIGNYRLEEIKSPEGYINTNQVWHFTVGGEGLDPYAGPIENNGRNLSDKITLQTIKASVLNPDTKTSTDITPQYNEIHPHWGESIEFTNKFELAKGIKINPGDYFTLKMSEQLDLNGIFEKRIDNLDIIAPGVGTIAKADYDRENRIITYTFTEYANTYTLVNFSNKLTAFIDLYKVKQSDREFSNQKVGFGIKVPEQPEEKIHYQYRDIKVVYDLDFGEETDHLGNSINLVSKIVKYNPETGEFLHYYYVNRKQENTAGPVEFRYESDQELENLNVSVSYVTNYGNVEEEMPESFGVNENSSNLTPFDTVNSLRQLEKGDYAWVKFDDGIHNTHNYIIKVTGRVAEEDKTEYTAHGTLYKFNDCYYPTYAERHDAIRYFVNQATAKVTLEITAVNPENKIVYKKVDQSGKAVPGAKFTLKYKAKEEDEYQDIVIDEESGKDGLVTFKKLKPGFYQLVETSAPTGYLKLNGPVEEFKVDKNGKIIRKETIPKPVGGSEQKEVEEYGVEPIYITNKKEHEIKFKKVDAESKTALEGAEFEVWYKPGKDGDYTKELKLYEEKYVSSGKEPDRLVLKKGEKYPSGYKATEDNKFTTGESGLLMFSFYEPGYYALKETKAPEGYMTPKDYVYEFRLENGKVQVLKNNVDKVTTKDGYLESQVLEVDKDNNRFTQRIIINPNHNIMKFKAMSSYLRIVEDGWKIDTVKFGSIKSNDPSNTITYSDLSYSPEVVGSEKRYYLKDLYNYSTSIGSIIEQKSKVIEITGTINEDRTSADIKTDLIVEQSEGVLEDNITFMIDLNKDISNQSAYTNVSNTKPIEIKNKKPTYPSTGGTGTKIAFAIIGTAVMLAAIAYFGIFQNDKNRRRSARYKK